MTGRYERVEVITGVARRRWSAAEKLRIVGDLSRPGASVSSVARDHDLNPSLLFKWRRLAREGAFGPLPDDGPSFVPTGANQRFDIGVHDDLQHRYMQIEGMAELTTGPGDDHLLEATPRAA